MKKYIILALAAMIMTACLDKEPQDFTSPSTWYSNQDELEMALATVYDPLRDVYSDYISVYLSQATDEVFSKESAPQMIPYYYNHDKADNTVKVTWQELYKGIDNANVLLENADNADCDAEVIKQIKGEALFLRGYYHFLLTAYWGDVPLKLSSTPSADKAYTPKSSSAEIYLSVFKDMETALDMVADLSALGFSGRVSKQAVKGILARVYLNAAGRLGKEEYYGDARKWAKSLIDEQVCALNASYKDAFINLMQDRYELKESVFEVECHGHVYSDEMRETAGFASYYTPQFSKDYIADDITKESIARGRGYFYCTPQLYELYEDGDLRRDWTIMPYMYENIDGINKLPYNEAFRFRYPGKFRREYEINLPVYSWGNSTNYPLLRYSDVLLMFAEADNHVNQGSTTESLEAVNQVRRRAFGLDPMTPAADVDKTAMSQADFLKYIKDERARELAMESHRKLDLIRWGDFLDRMKEIGEWLEALPVKVTVNGNEVYNPMFTQNGSGFPYTSTNPTGPQMVARSYKNVAARHLLLPIPELEMSVNKAITENNPGWE